MAALTPDVAAQLDENGHFVFDAPIGSDVPWITETRARELAAAYWFSFGHDLRVYASNDRGAPVAANLAVCERAHLAESGYDPFPENLHPGYRHAWGASWVVGLCSGSEQQVAIAVSVELTNMVINASGFVDGVQSGDFFSTGVKPGTTIPAAPEYAAVLTANRSKVLVSDIPRLRRLAQHGSPFTAVWTFPLNSSVQIAGLVSGRERSRSYLSVGWWDDERDLRILDANPDDAGEPREETVSFPVNGTPTTVTITRRADVPVRWEPVARRNP
ncbi:MAG: hypothetical protein IPJ78_19075 [Gemmatimonadetes bacterium]|nr:hypothetical protein [Gemmatimonadota bacterium]